MYVIKYSEKAYRDLTEIYNFISNDSKDKAVKYLIEFEKTICNLEQFPELGTISRYKELANIGILCHDDYLIFYTIDKEKYDVFIIRVLRSSMDYVHMF